MRAYVKIWNEFFRDQNVDNAAVLKSDDADVTYSFTPEKNETLENDLQNAVLGGNLLPVNKYHDYFTSCMPYPQRGPEVALPMQGNAPVRAFIDTALTKEVKGYGTVAGAKAGTWEYGKMVTDSENARTLEGYPQQQAGYYFWASKTAGQPDYDKGNYSRQAYMGADLSAITAATINDLRQAVAVQQYYEALSRGGSRYREQVQALWDVTISDKTVQIPEYLGGGRYQVNVNQIIQTSGQQNENGTPLGETGAVSVTPIRESSFTKSFEEHGFVIGVACVRHNRSYQQGLERFWSRKDRLDYYVPQFANLGEQPVKKKEIMLTGDATDEETFGYQEAWADYRMKPNRVSGLMRSNATGTLDFWHYADVYNTVPTLSQEWMAEGKAEIARTLIVQDEPQFFGAVRIANKTTRRMPLYSVPGLYKL